MTAGRTYTPVPVPPPGEPAVRCSWWHWCSWWPWCDRVAVYYVSRPVLDDVATCARCADRIRRAEA